MGRRAQTQVLTQVPDIDGVVNGVWGIPITQTRVPDADGDATGTWTGITSTQTNSPASSTGSSWTNPTLRLCRRCKSCHDNQRLISGSDVWGNYGFDLTGSTINQVRVRYDAWATPVSSTISLRSGATQGGGNTNGSGNFSVARPSSVSNGDVLVCIVGKDDNGDSAWNS